MGLLPLGSLKRGRAVNSGIPAISCMVDGCDADPINCKEYHRRHKVSEMHSRSLEVTIWWPQAMLLPAAQQVSFTTGTGNILMDTTVGKEGLS